MSDLRIATRKSPLALWQAHHVAGLLRAQSPELEVSLVELSTEGDRFLSAPLSAVGGKGLFVKEIEQALLDGRAEIAVHSLKDLTSWMPEELMLAAVPEREDPRDAFCSPAGLGLDALPEGASIGTSSLRRSCILRAWRPDLKIVSVRGNVQTRLARTRELGLAGAMLAAAGLKRLGMEREITEVLPPERSLPAVGQGVLALQCRRDDPHTRSLLAALAHEPTRVAVAAERAFLAHLEGGCSVPMAGYATVREGRLHLRGLISLPDGTEIIQGEREGAAAEAEAMGTSLAGELLTRGADAILREYGARERPNP